MQWIETKINYELFGISLWRRYVDDVICIFNENKEEEILQHINSVHKSIKFTLEKEKDGKLAFLDVLLEKTTSGNLTRKVYRKQMHSNRYLHYDSYHHFTHKVAVVDSLIDRAFNICDEDSLDDELNYVTRHLQNNSYPRKLIESRIKNYKSKANSNLNGNPNQVARFILPFTDSLTYKLAHLLQRKYNYNMGYIPSQKKN